MAPVQVIYLMGTPFCGSTILGAALGMHPDVFNAGELLYWTHKTKKSGPCSCGKPTEACEFWSEVGRELSLEGVDLAHYRALQYQFEFVRASGGESILRRHETTAASEYAATTLAILGAIRRVCGRSIIVDTSKHPARGAALARIPSLNISFIHLVRNGKAFVTSRMKRLKRGDPLRRAYIAQQSLTWSLTNLGIEFVCRAARRPFVRLCYEDLLDSPQEWLRRIGQDCSLDMNQVAERIGQGQAIEFGHAVSGNALRVAGPIPLRREDHGSADFPANRNWIFSVLAGPVASRYGYRRSR